MHSYRAGYSAGLILHQFLQKVLKVSAKVSSNAPTPSTTSGSLSQRQASSERTVHPDDDGFISATELCRARRCLPHGDSIIFPVWNHGRSREKLFWHGCASEIFQMWGVEYADTGREKCHNMRFSASSCLGAHFFSCMLGCRRPQQPQMRR